MVKKLFVLLCVLVLLTVGLLTACGDDGDVYVEVPGGSGDVFEVDHNMAVGIASIPASGSLVVTNPLSGTPVVIVPAVMMARNTGTNPAKILNVTAPGSEITATTFKLHLYTGGTPSAGTVSYVVSME